MEMAVGLMKGKGIVEDLGSPKRHLHKENYNGKRDPSYLHGFIPHCAQTPYLVRQLPSQKMNIGANCTDLFVASALNNLDGQGNLKRGPPEQLGDIERSIEKVQVA